MSEFVICIDSEIHPASLIVGKVYRALSDTEAQTRGLLRVLDENIPEPDGYLYPTSIFVPVDLPEVAEQA